MIHVFCLHYALMILLVYEIYFFGPTCEVLCRAGIFFFLNGLQRILVVLFLIKKNHMLEFTVYVHWKCPIYQNKGRTKDLFSLKVVLFRECIYSI